MSIDISMQYDRLYRYCYYHTHNRILAQDIVQEAFTRYMERYGSLNEKNAVPHLYVIAKNLCIDHYRRQSMHTEKPLQEQTYGENLGEGQSTAGYSALEDDTQNSLVTKLRKIFRGRITIPALTVSAGMLLGIALINYLVISPYDRSVYEREAALEGRALDDALLAELAAEAEAAGGLSEIRPDSPYYHLAGYISRMQGTGLVYLILTVTAAACVRSLYRRQEV